MMKWVSRVFTSKFYPVLCIASHSHDVYALSHQEDTAWIVSLTILALVQDKRQRASLKLAHQDFTWQHMSGNVMLTSVLHICRVRNITEGLFSWNPTKRGQPRQTLMSLIGGGPLPLCIHLTHSSMKRNSKHAYLPPEENGGRGSCCLKFI